jgi:hypothetical protein
MFNIYCDESCHLENDGQNSMVIGSIKVPRSILKEISENIKDIKERHGLDRQTEIKWTKVSPAKTDLYLDLIDYFFDNQLLTFRAIIIKDKRKLDHSAFDQSHDDWYYKMYYLMLRPIIDMKDLHIYIDIKDTNSSHKVVRLREYLCNYLYDFNRERITKMQLIRSEESQVLQLADLLMGAVSYENRGLSTSPAKTKVVQKIKDITGYSLTNTTVLSERKFNLFTWEPQQKF